MLRENILPNVSFEIADRWSGILGVGNTKQPILKQLTNDVAVAVRLGGMGIAIGSIIGERGAQLLME